MPYAAITKNALANAMKQLMAEKPFLKISVGDICERCGMNRKSFYYHFKDKYDLVNWIFQTEFIEALKVPDYTSGWGLLADICQYLYSEKAFYNSALQYEGQNSFKEYFSSTIESILMIIVSDHFRSQEDSRFFITFFTDAFEAAIVRWLTMTPEIAPDEFVQKLKRVMMVMAEQINEGAQSPAKA